MHNGHHRLIRWPQRLLRGVGMLVLVCFTTNQVAPVIQAVQAAERQAQAVAGPQKTTLDVFSDDLVALEDTVDRTARRLNGEHEFPWQDIASRASDTDQRAAVGAHSVGDRASAPPPARRADLRTLEASLTHYAQQIDAVQGPARAYFAQVGEQLRSRHVPAEAIARHDEQVAQFENALSQLQTLLRDVREARTEAAFRTAVLAASSFMKTHSAKAPRTHFDPRNEFSMGRRDAKVRAPGDDGAAINRALGLGKSGKAKDAPLVESIASTATATVLAPELSATVDAPLSDAIRAQATALHNSPREIYAFVRNTIAFTPTYGSIQGAEFTLNARRGNAFDQASLLIALLRAANVPARYVYGTVEAPLAQVQNWVGGTENANATLAVLSRGGIPAVAVTEAGIVRRVKWEHVWVEAFLDYVPSRGERPRTGDTWIPMDPSFKQYAFTGGMNLASNVAFDAQTLLDQAQQGATVNETEGWVQNLNQSAVQTGIEDYRTRLTDFVTAANPDATVGDVLGTQKILPESLPWLPSTLPNRVVAIAQRWAELPASLRWQFAFETDGTALLNRSLPELAGKRMALSFTPATPADEETLASFIPPDANGPEDLPTSLPAGVIDLVAEYSIDGETIARGGTYGLGYTVTTRQRLFEPGAGWHAIDNTLAAGDYQAVGLDVSGPTSLQTEQIRDKFIEARNAVSAGDISGLGKHDYTGIVLQAGIIGYFAQTASKGRAEAMSADVLLYRLPSLGTLSTKSTVTFWFGVPRRVIPNGLAFDVDRNALASVHKRSDQQAWKAFNASYNHLLSANEHTVLEELFSNQQTHVLGVSTVKALAVAAAQGQRIYTITAQNLSTALSQITLPAEVKADIANAVNAGFQVTTHQADIQYAGLVTAGYAIEDPDTGIGAMLISTGDNGGFAMFALTFILMIAALFAVIAVFASGAWIVGSILLFFLQDSFSDWLNRVSNANNPREFSQANFIGALSALLAVLPIKLFGPEARLTVIWFESFLMVFEWTWFDDGIP